MAIENDVRKLRETLKNRDMGELYRARRTLVGAVAGFAVVAAPLGAAAADGDNFLFNEYAVCASDPVPNMGDDPVQNAIAIDTLASKVGDSLSETPEDHYAGTSLAAQRLAADAAEIQQSGDGIAYICNTVDGGLFQRGFGPRVISGPLYVTGGLPDGEVVDSGSQRTIIDIEK